MPQLAEHAARGALQDLVVFECNWVALEVFLNCTTQWRMSPMGDIQALDYASVRAVIDMMGIKRKERADVFKRLRLIEAGALPALRKLRERK